MAGPITWRNVDGGGGGSAVSLLNMGQQQLQQGLASISDLIRSNQATERENFVRARDNNTQSYLDAVANAGGLDALQNPETRANLEAMRAQFGAAIDRGATRNAIDSRIANLQQQQTAAAQFEDVQTERAQRSLIDEGVKLALAGDSAGVQKLLADTQFLNEGQLTNQLMGIVDAGTRRQYAAADQARADRNEIRQIAQFRESMAAAAENREMRKEARADAKAERDYQRNARVLDDAAKQAQAILERKQAGNPWAKTSQDPGKDAQTILADLPKGEFDSWLSRDQNDRRAMQDSVQKLLTEGVTLDDGTQVKIPPAMLQQELQALKGTWWITSSPAKDLERHFKDSLSGNAGAGARAQAAAAQQLRADANNFTETLKRAKTKLGSTATLDTSGIVAGLAELAGGVPVSRPEPSPSDNLLPGREEDEKLR